MRITFYKSSLCPRCYLAGKWLKELAGNRSDVEIVSVDVLTAPARTHADGVRMIPALIIGNRRLSGLFLTREAIRKFLVDNGWSKTP